ncbi:MAG: ParB/RepB/Spo0J family partition protein [Ilumatobacteraceae bacterium]
MEIPVGSIVPNPHQPRVHFEEAALDDLAASIKEIGVLQPILVRSLGDGSYELVAGERRWRATRRAGLDTIPAVVRTTDDMGSVLQALVENLHRQDLTPLEESAAYSQMIEDFSLTHEQVAQRVGKSRSAVSNSLRLLSLPASIQSLLADGRLSAGHAKALLGTPDRSFQEGLAKRAVSEGWTVRMLEDAVREREGRGAPVPAADDDNTPTETGRTGGGAGDTAPPLRPPGLLELENLLSEYLSTRVSVNMGATRGKVVIEFADLEDLERIYHHMTANGGATA